jgi:hypothetical protein
MAQENSSQLRLMLRSNVKKEGFLTIDKEIGLTKTTFSECIPVSAKCVFVFLILMPFSNFLQLFLTSAMPIFLILAHSTIKALYCNQIIFNMKAIAIRTICPKNVIQDFPSYLIQYIILYLAYLLVYSFIFWKTARPPQHKQHFGLHPYSDNRRRRRIIPPCNR